MSPQRIASTVRREVPLLREDECLRDALSQIIDANVPALPVVDATGKLHEIFGVREFHRRAVSRLPDDARLRRVHPALARRVAREARDLRLRTRQRVHEH